MAVIIVEWDVVGDRTRVLMLITNPYCHNVQFNTTSLKFPNARLSCIVARRIASDIYGTTPESPNFYGLILDGK